MSKLIRRIRYIVMIILFLLSARYALTLRLHYRDLLSRIDQAHQLPADPPEGGYSAAPKPTRRRPMAEAFRSGHLPDPLPVPSGDPDQIAADLAKKIAAKDDQSTAALLTALQMAGFGIYSPEGQLAVKPTGASQGMAFGAFSVAAMAKLYNDGWHMSLADLSAVLTKAIPAFQKVSLNETLANGIATASQGEQPLRFWSRLIIELGKQSWPGYDLSSGKLDPTVELDSIQTSLILQRLYGDLMSRTRPERKKPQNSALYGQITGLDGLVFPAAFHPGGGERLVLTGLEESESTNPCENEFVKTVLDADAILRTTEWKALINSEEIEPPGARSYANAALTILKIVWVYATLHVDVKMTDSPLVRSEDTSNGQSRILTAHVWFDTGKLPWLNCMRPFMKKADFGNLPNDGAAKGVGVWWLPAEGFGPGYGTIEFHNDPQGLIDAEHSQALVFFDTEVINGRVAGPTDPFRTTDPDGNATMQVTGMKQSRDLTNEKKVPVIKKMAVAVSVKYKQVSDVKDMLGEFLDVLGPGLGIASGDLPAALADALAETVFRMHWTIDGSFNFPVQDWLPCTTGWVGTINYKKTLNTSRTIQQPGGFVREMIDNLEEGQFQITGPRSSDDDGLYVGTYSYRLANKRSHLAKSNFSGDPSTSEMTETASGAGKANFDIDARMDHNAFIIAAGTGESVEVKTKMFQHKPDSTGTYTALRQPEGTGASGTMDPKNPNELKGSKTDKSPDGTVTTVEWNLVRCSKWRSPNH
jgi:hypothetical protein